jgi:hypothetical protein
MLLKCGGVGLVMAAGAFAGRPASFCGLVLWNRRTIRIVITCNVVGPAGAGEDWHSKRSGG